MPDTECRFGSTDEVGLFELTKQGLCPLVDPAAFLKSRQDGAGTAACATAIVMEGNRAVLVEVQVPPLRPLVT
jgi:DNA repair protein RadA/Sms